MVSISYYFSLNFLTSNIRRLTTATNTFNRQSVIWHALWKNYKPHENTGHISSGNSEHNLPSLEIHNIFYSRKYLNLYNLLLIIIRDKLSKNY